MQTKKFHIKGMHCVSCEKLLDDEFRRLPGVKNVRVDRMKNTGEVDHEGAEMDFSEIQKVAKKFGYEASEEPFRNAKTKKEGNGISDWLKALAIVGIIFFLYKIFQGAGVVERIDSDIQNMSYGVAFLVGLVASLSSCLVIVGAVVIAFGEKYRSGGKGFYAGAVEPNILFHIGRLSAFFILGGLLGLIGGELDVSGNFVSAFTIIIAIIMGWLGLNILGFVPNISDIGVRMPKGLTKKWSNLKASEHKAAPFLLGGLSFFLPCGFTQSMQIFALASGSFWTGGLMLLIFALGTMPSLLALGITASWTRNNRMAVFQKVAGILIITFAFYAFQSGLALRGVGTNVLGTGDTGQPAMQGSVKEEQQVVEMRVTNSGFVPATLKIKKDVPVRWVIKGEQVSGCTNRIIVPSLDISKPLKTGENIVEFTPTKAGTIPFSCWMGMVKGRFIVE